MIVHSLVLPASFERFIRTPDLQMMEWVTQEGSDAYGNYWNPCPLRFFTDPETMAQWTNEMPHAMRVRSQTPEQIAERNALAANNPGAIPFITDFSRILIIERNGSADVLALDYRDNPEEPSVIFLDEWYWRRVAPDFDTFLALIEPWDESGSLEDREERLWQKFHPDYDPNCAFYEAQPISTAARPQGDAGSRTQNAQLPDLPRAPLPRSGGARESMIVNGLSLPASFQQFVAKHPDRVWDLKENVDAYGHPLKARFQPYSNLEKIREYTASMARPFGALGTSHYDPEDRYSMLVIRAGGADLSNIPPEMQEKVADDLEAARLGYRYLPRITDYSQIVWFGCSPPLAPFCFDFRENPQEPSVIHMPWGEIRWRRISPNFETYIRLFECDEEGHGEEIE